MINDTKGFSRNLNLLLLFSTIIILDQVAKYLAETSKYSVVCNRGIAFGLGSVGILIPLVGLILVIRFLAYNKSHFSRAGLVLIAAGGVSNLIDRVFVGCVRDFISIYNFPVFNFADVAITLGILTIIGNLISGKEDKSI